MDESLSALQKHFGLSQAENVLLTGCSAGGLATYLHTDYVHGKLQQFAPTTLKRFKSAPISGFFLQHKTVEGIDVYPQEMKNIYELANSTDGLNADCVAKFAPEDQWQCNFAAHAYAHTKSMIFPLNSALDSWQTGCIYTSRLPEGFPNQTVPGNGHCSAVPHWIDCANNPETCDQSQIQLMNVYMEDFLLDMDTAGDTHTSVDDDSPEAHTGPYNKPGNGAFIHSCHTHCEAQSDAFDKFAVNGVTMQQAVSKWWNSDGTESAESHSYAPCEYKDGETGPRACNPTCL